MRIFINLVMALVVAPLYCLQLFAKTLSADVTQVSDAVTVIRINSKAGNTNSVLIKHGNESLLIDQNFYQTSQLLKDTIKTLGVVSPTYLSVSHTHRDHTEQLADFHNAENLLITSETQLKHLRNDNLINEEGNIKVIDKVHQIKLNNLIVEITPLPAFAAHTQGDLVFYVTEQKTLVVGDYLFTHGYPIIDKHLGDINGYFNNLEFILKRYPEASRVVAGHSAIAPIPQAIFNYQQFRQRVGLLKQSVCSIKKHQSNGMSVEALKSIGLAKKFSAINSNAVFVKASRWIDYVYKQKVTICDEH